MTTTTTAFALRTADTDWIERNHGIADPENDRIFVQVPAAEVERFDRTGRPWIRHVFADIPSDALNAAISCPAEWVESFVSSKGA
jgi:hypothetical protein